ncbi:hypothetical protein TNCV_4664111, partial [Trichonephila clavipes]
GRSAHIDIVTKQGARTLSVLNLSTELATQSPASFAIQSIKKTFTVTMNT